MRGLMFPVRSVLVLSLFVVGCGKASHGPAADAGTDAHPAVASASAAPVALDGGAAAAGPTGPQRYLVFADKAAHHLAIERNGNLVRAILDTGVRLELAGKMTDDTHFALRATKAPHGEKPAKLTGELGPGNGNANGNANGTAKTTLVDAAGKSDDTWTAGAGLAPKWDAELLGRIGKSFVRMKLSASTGAITGKYRYAASPSDLALAGTLHDDGSFELTEASNGKPTGSLSGVLASPDAILGQWRSPDGSKSLPFIAEHGDGYPAGASFDNGVELFPQEKVIEGKRCKTDTLFPQLRGGKDAKALRATNDFLRGENAKARTCEGPGDDDPDMMDYETNESYALDTTGGRFIGIHRDVWDYSGGVHGNYGSECLVIDTKTLQHFKLAPKLTDAGRVKLAALVVTALTKEHEVAKLTDADYFNDTIELSADSDVCLHDETIEVSFDPYEIGPYAIGPSSAKLPKAQVKSFFVQDDVTRAIFGK